MQSSVKCLLNVYVNICKAEVKGRGKIIFLLFVITINKYIIVKINYKGDVTNEDEKALINIDYTNDFVAKDGALTCGKPGQRIEKKD